MQGPECTFIHAADLHLDSPFSGLGKRLGEDFVAKASRASIETLDALFNLAKRENADFMVIAGDLYDGATVGIRAKAAFFDAVRGVESVGVRVFLALGNHDPVDEPWYLSSELPGNLHIFQKDEPESVSFTSRSGVRVSVTGISYGKRHETDNLAKRFAMADPSIYSVGVLHGNVENNQTHQPYAPAALSDITQLNYDYFALGHIHRFQILCDAPPVVYAGTLQGRSPKPSELGEKGAVVVKGSKHAGSIVRFVPLASVRFECIDVTVSDIADDSDLAVIDACESSIMQFLESEKNFATCVLRLRLCGSSDVVNVQRIDGEAIAVSLQDRLARLIRRGNVYIEKVSNEIRPSWSIEGLATGNDLVSVLARAALDERDVAQVTVMSPTQFAVDMRRSKPSNNVTELLRILEEEGVLAPTDIAEIRTMAIESAISSMVDALGQVQK